MFDGLPRSTNELPVVRVKAQLLPEVAHGNKFDFVRRLVDVRSKRHV